MSPYFLYIIKFYTDLIYRNGVNDIFSLGLRIIFIQKLVSHFNVPLETFGNFKVAFIIFIIRIGHQS